MRIVCLLGDCVPVHAVVDGCLELGRDPHCDIRLLGPGASRYHAQLRLEDDGTVILVDNRSRNGVEIDGQRITSTRRLQVGQRFRIAEAEFILLDDQDHDPGIVADAGGHLQATADSPIQAWRNGDNPQELASLHALVRHLGTASDHRQRAALLCQVCQHLLSADRVAVVRQGTVLAGQCSPRLAARLAGGRQARLLVLGEDLRGHTIASEAVGSALTAPLGNDTWILAIRIIDREPFSRSALQHVARVAGESRPYFSGQATANPFAGLVGESSAMRQLRARLKRLAAVDTTVLITGESGTGKELIASCLHAASGRSDGPLVAVNCAAIAPGLAEAELFGHSQGAFTGATQAKPGRIRAAHGGTLFLDEVGELPLDLQAKLLRVLQEGSVEPVGQHQSITVDIRVLAATHRDLASMVSDGSFREDLYYRLDVLRIHASPLRERRDDIPVLAQHLLARLADEHGRFPPRLSDSAQALLAAQQWPGNIRQLGNCLERAMVWCDTMIDASDLDCGGSPASPRQAPPTTLGDHFPSLAEMEAQHISAALHHCQGNKSATARILGISRPTLLRKLSEYGIVS